MPVIPKKDLEFVVGHKVKISYRHSKSDARPRYVVENTCEAIFSFTNSPNIMVLLKDGRMYELIPDSVTPNISFEGALCDTEGRYRVECA